MVPKQMWLWLSMVGMIHCSNADTGNPCPSGICPGNLPGSDGGMLLSDSGVCVETWSCTTWAVGAGGTYTRVCTDTNGCATSLGKPSEGPVALPSLDMPYYKCKVEPIVDRGCAMMGCHGTSVSDGTRAYRVFARGRRRNSQTVPAMCLDSGSQNLDKGTATIMCYGWSGHSDDEWQKNYDSARALMVGVANVDDCDLLSQPVVGGKAHTGVHLFASRTDPDYLTIKAWLMGATLPSCDPMN